ncbi:MAG: exodeoxyribonuclease VII small subunit [Clostridiales bacterium]|jgi:exodeoxyribonuclease VII small subunit|nr:exodeoxyribonuclease VII small subunit [Clostridiales bacterium]
MNQHNDKPLSELSFEESIKELEDIVSRLESDNLTLDEALRLFKRGINLSVHCNAMLDKAEGLIKILSQDQGKYEEIPFEPAEGDTNEF